MAGRGAAFPIQPSKAAGMAREVWTAVGIGFFEALVKHLSAVLGASLVFIGEVRHQPVGRMVALAVSDDSTRNGGFEYKLAGTASAEVLAHGTGIYERGVRRTFPGDASLEKAHAEAFAGKALFDSKGQAIGAIVALWRRSLHDPAATTAVLEAFAPRAAAELERKRAEDNLRESEQRYHAFVSANKDAMWRLEFEKPIPTNLPEDEQIDRMYRYGYVAECNRAAARMWILPSPDALIGKRLTALVPRTGTEVDDLRRVIRSRYRADDVAIRRIEQNGKRAYRLRSYLGIVEKGKLLRLWVITRDATQLKKAELRWRVSERRFRKLLETIRMAAVMLNREGRVTFCNDYLLSLTGWSKEDVLGKNWFDLMVPEEFREHLRSAFDKFISEGCEHRHLQAVVRTRDGRLREFEWDDTIIHDAEGQVAALARMGKDITQQKLLEARLTEADKLESVRRLAGAIAHDFNNLLMIIRSSASLLLEAHQIDPLRGAAEEVMTAGEQGAALTRHLLSFSRDKPVEPTALRLNDVITENQTIIRRILGGNIQLVLNLNPTQNRVLADPGQIHQVLVNLTMNAHDAMPEGGSLTITTANIEAFDTRPAGIPEAAPGSYVMLEVADTGSGMPEEVRAHVFEPFFTTKSAGGTGLGLASVYGIVRQSGGYIAVDSAPGKGATFRLLFPALADDAEAPPAEAGQSTTPQAGQPTVPRAAQTVLLLEGEAPLLALVAKALRDSGYEVTEAGTASDALTAAAKAFDLLLADSVVPEIESGELVRRLKATNPNLKVLYISDYATTPTGEASIEKPFTVEQLMTRVRDLLGADEPPRAPRRKPAQSRKKRLPHS